MLADNTLRTDPGLLQTISAQLQVHRERDATYVNDNQDQQVASIWEDWLLCRRTNEEIVNNVHRLFKGAPRLAELNLPKLACFAVIVLHFRPFLFTD